LKKTVRGIRINLTLIISDLDLPVSPFCMNLINGKRFRDLGAVAFTVTDASRYVRHWFLGRCY
jgi:hypothetical protein